MANRIVLDPNGLKVSKPGHNVLTASQANLIFDSDYSAMGVHGQGEITINFTGTQSISFGKTFPSSPFVTFERRIGSEYIKLGDLSGFHLYYTQDVYDAYWNGEDWVDSWAGQRWFILSSTVTTTGISFMGDWDRPNGTSNTRPPNVTIRYSVYDFGL